MSIKLFINNYKWGSTNLFTRLTIVFCLLVSFNAGAQNGSGHKTDSAKRISDSLNLKLTNARKVLNKINAASKKVYAPKQVRLDLNNVKKNILPIKNELRTSEKAINNRTLTGYNVLLKRSQERLGAYRKALSRSSDDLKKTSGELKTIRHDSLLEVSKADSITKPVYAAQLNYVRSKLTQTDNYLSTNLDSVNRLLSDVSAAYLEIADMQSDINDRLKTAQPSAFHKEASYLWSAPKEVSNEKIAVNIASSYEGQNRILSDFINTTWDDRMLDILLGGLFLLWVCLNYRKAVKPDLQQKIGELDFRHITPVPIVASLIIILVLAPLCEANAPSTYIQMIHFLLLIALTVFFWTRLAKSELRYWLFTVFLYVVMLVTNAAVHEDVFMRVWFIVLNLSSLYFGIVFSNKLLRTEVAARLIRPVLIIYVVLNSLAVILNIFGRITLAKTLTITAIIGLTEVIGLAVFIQLLTDALELQIKVSACNGGLFSRVDLGQMRASFKGILAVVSIILWLLVFIINLNIAKDVFGFIDKLLDNKRSFGSISFTIGNVLFFAVILYLSNLFQKHIGVLFGEKSVTFSNQVEHKSSKLTLFRLVIAILGVLLAVTASGIPLDKLTVVLGALSVGIGLGMQNIVNNFVSGIILIFERPFQIGDFVELGDKKGKIQDIGIRASKMLTQQGSEVVIPNGDLISNRFVNWTINSAYVKSEILFKINISADIKTITAMIQEEVEKSAYAVKDMPVEVLINSIAADSVELRILMWITSIYVESNFKSELFSALIARFNTAQIKIM